jgi:hypothetical protein
LRSRFGSRLWVSVLLLPAASFADQAIMRTIVLVAIARAGDVVRS